MQTDFLKRQLHVLHLEDDEKDHLFVAELLRTNGLTCDFVLATSQEEFSDALKRAEYDLIISDFTLPSYDGLTALSLAQSLKPRTPFIFFSGTIGEEIAVDTLKNGATDYVLKQRPHRLVAAVHRALRNAAERRRLEKTERELRQTEERLRIITHATNDVIWEWDVQNNRVSFNENFQTVFGYPANESGISSERWFDFIHPDDKGRVVSGISTLLASRGRIWWSEHRICRDDHSHAYVLDRASIVYDAEGKPQRMIGVTINLSEHKQAEEKIKQLEDQFLRAQRFESLGVLASGIAHDLNNALVPLMVGVQIMREQKNNPPKIESILSTMETSVRRGAEMVKQVLTFGRDSSAPRKKIHVELLLKEMGDIIGDVFSKNIQCRVSTGEKPWPVSAFPTQLHQVLMNLCVNARDAMPKGGTLTLATENVSLNADEAARLPDAKPGKYLCITVADTGTGISSEDLEKIFQPFYTTKAPGKGTGLGLATSQTIVKNHGGFMTVKTKVGHGTEFKIYLPAETTEAVEETPGLKPLPPAGNGECILIVDDEESVLAITRSALENYNYNVLVANSGLEAVTQLTEKRDSVSLVITDLDMPFMDGATTITALRKIVPEIKIIVASGSEKEIEDAREVKMDAFIAKPFTSEELLGTVHAVLAKK